ncbi:MAG: bifunctional hydroxymethylpyrimidine kinase/phosphomethylpyrimidine kinase [Acidobacteria bacterium]|nr:bifunctional hydroxymethylpyrimidine kinase/phosphomethylpyrimidine kinase [Acidobacteriota bacterium]
MAYKNSTIPRVLIVAGSDSSGGAGIQADLKTVSALGAYGMTALTAVTAQNTLGVFEVVEMEARFVARQMQVCLADIGCDAVKTGMLSSAAIIDAVAAALPERRQCPVVVDPVMLAKSGTPLLKPEAAETLKKVLLPLATVVTPNLPEAGILLGREINSLKQMREAARAIRDLGPEYVVIKGGHLEGNAVDVMFDGQEFFEYPAGRIQTKNSHGTGCIFASAIAAGLAKGKTVRESVAGAKEFVTHAIAAGLPLGGGQGPANPSFSHGLNK